MHDQRVVYLRIWHTSGPRSPWPARHFFVECVFGTFWGMGTSGTVPTRPPCPVPEPGPRGHADWEYVGREDGEHRRGSRTYQYVDPYAEEGRTCKHRPSAHGADRARAERNERVLGQAMEIAPLPLADVVWLLVLPASVAAAASHPGGADPVVCVADSVV